MAHVMFHIDHLMYMHIQIESENDRRKQLREKSPNIARDREMELKRLKKMRQDRNQYRH